MQRGADISRCGAYRYALDRTWDKNLRRALFIGVSPSTADGDVDDATIRKLIGFCKRNSIGGFTIVNLFAYRATDVRELKSADDPIGPENNDYIIIHQQSVMRRWNPDLLVVAMWGNKTKLPKELRSRIDEVSHWFRPIMGQVLHCFGQTKSGCPRHPLMLSYDTKIVSWEYGYKDD